MPRLQFFRCLSAGVDRYVDSSIEVFAAPDAAETGASVATGLGLRSSAGTIHSPLNHCRC